MTTPTSAVRWATAAAAGDPVALARQEIADLQRCAHCGRTGQEGMDVYTCWRWVGGTGDVLTTFCRDSLACFARRERRGESGRSG